jgi:hypothetical protein
MTQTRLRELSSLLPFHEIGEWLAPIARRRPQVACRLHVSAIDDRHAKRAHLARAERLAALWSDAAAAVGHGWRSDQAL